jgi:hypothetical protein
MRSFLPPKGNIQHMIHEFFTFSFPAVNFCLPGSGSETLEESIPTVSGATRYNKKVTVGDFSYENKEIRLGDLSGNRFELAVRNMDRTDDQLRPVIEAFKEMGFINYFGMQRQA